MVGVDHFEISGELISEDAVALLAARECKVPGSDIDEGDCAAAFELLHNQWNDIRVGFEKLDTEGLRKRWLQPVFDLLGYDLQYQRSHTEFGQGQVIPITHRSPEIPVWMLENGQGLDDKPTEGRRRISPHELFQRYLNFTADDWGLVTNGLVLRLLNDNPKQGVRNYVEVNIANLFEARDYPAWRAVWRIFRVQAFQKDSKGERPVERLKSFSQQEGVEIGKELRTQVTVAIKTLANGFLAADHSGKLMEELQKEPGNLMLFYRALLRIIYRLLFLLFIDRKPGWTPSLNRVWQSSYAISRLIAEAQGAGAMGDSYAFARARSEDHWEGLKVVFRIIRDGTKAFSKEGKELKGYGGDLFDPRGLLVSNSSDLTLSDLPLYNEALLQAVRNLTLFQRRKKGRQNEVYKVNFANLPIDALGSVYEALLDLAPVLTDAGEFDFGAGTDRKLSGSYYTPPALVDEIVKSTLLPVIDDRLKGLTNGDQEKALLNIKVVDPACGSGAFLIKAMDALALKLCEVRRDGEEPTELDLREARREVVTRCIHGVDINPMSVELCKFTLWLHVAHPDLPLSFLEPVILCGNALIGVPLKGQVERRKEQLKAERAALVKQNKLKEAKGYDYVGWEGFFSDQVGSIPDDAFNPVTGDNVAVARARKKENKDQRGGQMPLGFAGAKEYGEQAEEAYQRMKNTPENWETYGQKKTLYEMYKASGVYLMPKQEADLWTSAFFWKHESLDDLCPTQHWFRQLVAEHRKEGPIDFPRELLEKVDALSRPPKPGFPEESGLGFFHWEIEFPDMREQGGFDCVLGNPPWERINVKTEEFFLNKDETISRCKNKSERSKLIAGLPQTNKHLFDEYFAALRFSDALDCFLRYSQRFVLSATGDINTYVIFTELSRDLLSRASLAGIVVPVGIATDDTTKDLFSDLVRTGSLRSLIGFENEEFIFPHVHHAFKFCLLSLSYRGSTSETTYAFFCRTIKDTKNENRRFQLTASELEAINPNTQTCPIFRTNTDARLTTWLQSSLPCLVDQRRGVSPWNISLRRMFHMSDDAELFLESPEGIPDVLPLYEAKMFYQFDHRFATYEGATQENLSSGMLPQTSEIDKADPRFSSKPKYWVPKHAVAAWAGDNTSTFLVAFRLITNAISSRTGIFTILPIVGAGNSVMFVDIGAEPKAKVTLCFLAMVNSLVFDYILRQKIGGNNLTFHVLRQTPILEPQTILSRYGDAISNSVLELVYTSEDMTPVARSLGYEGPPFSFNDQRRDLIRAELDAIFAHLYGLNRKQLRYILDPLGLSDKELEDITSDWEDPTCSGPHLLPTNPTKTFPGETFRVLKEKETKQYGEYRTRRLVLEAWEKLQHGELT